MKLTRFAMASVLATSVVGVGLAGPAAATDDITRNAVGTYDFLFKNQSTATVFWAADPCDDDADQCIKVAEFSASDTARKKPHWTKNAYWTVGSWIMEPVDATRTCKDKTKYNVTYSFSWDAAANTGYRSFFDPGVCDGNKPHNAASQFALVKVP
ncbi:hypothetical protein [Candidatus Mycolicibacterium alkanivorans]|uniref:Secreted protein n=1 Tax=Candidatus Mycolicibacterium alkanivorans TaxID=2954114 RepID=A0ABS9YRK6_9MYCO|nr:hypothetical protein [Candidatus Mycolicibacterium alkanivorans]MCI4673474.1 hypothetical protein [Candidatus Mycolicibacterium alkanivorans]